MRCSTIVSNRGTNATQPASATAGARHRGDDADNGAVGDEYQPDVAVRRADRLEHPERAQPPLRHHSEAGHRDQADEQERDRVEDEHGGGREAGNVGRPGLQQRAVRQRRRANLPE